MKKIKFTVCLSSVHLRIICHFLWMSMFGYVFIHWFICPLFWSVSCFLACLVNLYLIQDVYFTLLTIWVLFFLNKWFLSKCLIGEFYFGRQLSYLCLDLILLRLILSFIRAVQSSLFSRIQTTKVLAFCVLYWVPRVTSKDSTPWLVGAQMASSPFWVQKTVQVTILWLFFVWPYSL